METTVATVTTTSIEDTATTTLTIGSSSYNIDNLYDGIECTNMFLALIVLLLIVGWLYDYFKGLFDNV